MKLTKHAWIIWIISLLVVAALALLIPFAHTTVYWIALGCTAAMFMLCAFTFARAFRRDKTLESKLLGWPIFRVGYTAAAVQIIVGFALMELAPQCSIRAAIIVEIILFGFAGISLTAKDAAREAVVHIEASVSDKTGAWKAIRACANALAAENSDPQLRRLAEEIRYADPTPSSLDAEIFALLESLSQNADTAKLQRAFSLLQQRKSLIKEEKRA